MHSGQDDIPFTSFSALHWFKSSCYLIEINSLNLFPVCLKQFSETTQSSMTACLSVMVLNVPVFTALQILFGKSTSVNKYSDPSSGILNASV